MIVEIKVHDHVYPYRIISEYQVNMLTTPNDDKLFRRLNFYRLQLLGLW